MTRPRTLDFASTFVGRERELAELEHGVAAARAGRAALFFLRGDAGIGKTTLATALEHRAAASGQTTHWGRCIEGSGTPAFWPWIQILRSILRDRPPAILATLGDDERAGVARLVPELCAGGLGAPAAPADANTESSFQIEIERFQLFDGIARFLRRVAEHGALGLVLEDLHAADRPSLFLLEFVARQLPALSGMWIVGTYRPVEAHLDRERGQLITTVSRLGRSLTLDGLSELEVGRLIEHVVGEAPTPALRARIRELTEGNPFFVDEVARLLWASSDPLSRDSARLQVPAGVREVVRQRLQLLGEDCRRILEVAAAIGSEAPFRLMCEAGEVEPARLLDLLAEASAIGVLVARPERRHAFGHALIRETVYDDLRPSRQVELHRGIGAAIERLYAGALDEHLSELAFHFGRAAPAGDAEKALSYAERAAQRASSLLAYEDAARLYQMALDTLPLVAADVAGPRELELLLALGSAQVHAADSASARRTFERAGVLARRRGDAHGLARAALGCGGLGLGVPPGTVDRPLVGLLEEALQPAGEPLPAELRARLLSRLALELYFSDATERRRRLMDEASALGAACDPHTRAYVMHARLVGLWDLTPPARRLRDCDDLIELAESLRDEDLALRGHSYRLLEIFDTGIAGAWASELDTVTALAEKLREPRFLGMARGTRAMRSVWLGRFEEAQELGRQAIELAQAVSDLQAPISVAAQTFFMHRLQGKAEDVELTARALVSAMPSIPGTHCMLALALCDLGRLDEARRVIELLDDAEFSALRQANRLASLVPWLAEACAALGDVGRMQTLRRELTPLAGRNISLQARVCFGPADFYRGMLASGLGQTDEALACFASAHALARRLSGRPLMALIDVEHARALIGAGQLPAARRLLENASGIATALGLELILRKVGAIEARLAEDRRSPAETEEATFDARSRRGLRASLKRDGALWTIAAGDTRLRCRSSKGLTYLAYLLHHPGKSFHAIELMALDQGGSEQRLSGAEIDELGLRIGQPQAAEPIADAKAIAAYRRRIEGLAAELAEAEELNDLGRRDALRAEIDILSETLAGAVGIGGRLRATGSFAERARLNVTRAIRSAIERIAEAIPALGVHLDNAVRTGTFCSYSPSPAEPVRWDL